MTNLSIFIPTYNRPELLKQQLTRLLPQIENTKVIVVDNSSEQDIKSVIPSNVTYLRNRVNLGAAGNVLRCFELAETEWIWICSDDDPILPNAVENIKTLIVKYSDSCFISTSSPILSHTQDSVNRSVGELLSKLPEPGPLFWITAGLYNSKKLKPYFRVPCYLPSAAPHTAMMLTALANGHPATLTSLEISGHHNPSDEKERWNMYEVLAMTSDLVDLPIDINSRIEIARSLESCIIAFDEHFVRCCNAVAHGVPGAQDLVMLFASRWSKLYAVQQEEDKLNELMVRLRVLRNPEESRSLLLALGPDSAREIPPCIRFQRL